MFSGVLRRLGSLLLLPAVLANIHCTANRAEVRHPHLTTWNVCLRPPNVEPDARQWAVDSDTGTTVSNIDPDAFEAFLPHADVLYNFDFNAPAESAQLLPDEYAVDSCDGPDRILARKVNDSSDLPSSDSNPLRVVGEFGPHTEFVEATVRLGNFMGIDTPKKKKDVPVKRVCVRPPGIRADTKQWAATKMTRGLSYTTSDQQFYQAVESADVIFIYDPNAHPESVYEFGPPFDQLRCPGKPEPKPREQLVDQAQRRAQFEELVQQALKQAGATPHEGQGGSSKPTWTSSSTGKGEALSFFESVVRQTLITQGILAGDTSGDLKDPNGARYGLPNGKNPNGPDSFFLQFTAATFAFLPSTIKSGTQFIKRVAEAAEKNAVLIIADPKFLPKPIVEGLIKRFPYQMAGSLHRMKTILPYSRAQMFTAEWRGVYQAHHILEVDMAKKLNLTNMGDLPAIILTNEEHKAITNRLNDVRKQMLGQVKDDIKPEELWKFYQRAYRDHPIWLESIKKYLGN